MKLLILSEFFVMFLNVVKPLAIVVKLALVLFQN